MSNGNDSFDEGHFECLLKARKRLEESYFVSYINSAYNSDVEFQSTIRKFKLHLNKYAYTKDMRFEEEYKRYADYYRTKYNDYMNGREADWEKYNGYMDYYKAKYNGHAEGGRI